MASSPSIQLWQETPRRYQPRVDGIEGLPLTTDADEAAYMVQLICRLLGRPAADFGEALSPERRQAVEAQTRAFLQVRKMI